jgi:hypothetical protein
MTGAGVTLRFTHDRRRHFLIPDHCDLAEGDLVLMTPSGDDCSVRGDDVAPFEVTEEQARRWAKDQLGQTLDELRTGIDDKLAELRQRLADFNRRPVTEESTMTPDAAGAFLDFFKALPGVVGKSLSRDRSRVGAARDAMTDLQQRLKDAGIDVDDRVKDFPERVASLRNDREPPAD